MITNEIIKMGELISKITEINNRINEYEDIMIKIIILNTQNKDDIITTNEVIDFYNNKLSLLEDLLDKL